MSISVRIRMAFCLAAALVAVSEASGNIDNVRFSNISVNNGLPHNGIFDVLHDSRGFMWIGTREGLCRYDGYNMRVYGHDPSDTFTLPKNTIRSIFEDSRGRLWIGTEAGAALYDRDKDRFERLSFPDGNSEYVVLCILEIDGTIHISTEAGMFRFDERQRICIPLYGIGERSPLPPQISDMVDDDSGVIWLASVRGVFFFSPSEPGNVKAFTHPSLGNMQNNPVLTVAKDDRGRIWFGGWFGVFVYDPSDGSLRLFSSSCGLMSGIIRSIEFDSEQNVWVGGENGIDIISPQGTIRHISQGVDDVTGISDNAVYVIHRDHSGNMWTGTYFGGLNVMFQNTTGFASYQYGFSAKHLSGKAVRQIIADGKNSLWIAIEDGGLNRFDRRTCEFSHYTGREGGIKFSYHNVHSLLEDRHGNLWIGTFSGGVNRYDPRTGRTTRLRLINNGGESTMVFSLLEDPDGDIWIGTANGLFVQRAGSVSPEPVGCPELSNNAFIYSMACDSSGFLWIGTRRAGLYCYDKESDTVSRMPGSGLDHSFITTVMIDSSDNIWAGTGGSGVIYFDRSREKPVSYTTGEGLPSNSVMGIVSDSSGQMWISTDRGLCRFSQDPSRIRIYTTSDGLPTNLFNFGSAFRASDGELFFGSVNGMISFYPDRIDAVHPPLRVEFTEFQIQGRKVSAAEKHSPLENDITETFSVRLSAKEASSVGFSFTALNFSHAANIRYAIRMEGISSEWQDVGSEHRILFPNIRHGRYTLSVRASYDGIEWDEAGVRSIDIQVLPPFWLSVWAMLIYLLMAAGAATGIWFFARGRIRMRQRMDGEAAAKLQAEELNRQKMVLFGNISHDLKTPLTLILGPLQKTVADKKTDPETRNTLSVVLQNAQRMKNLLEELVLMSKIEMGHMKVTVQQGDVLEFIDRMCDIFRVFAGDNGINFFVNVDNPEGRKVWFSPTNIERIVYNLLSNAFKFTPYGGIIRIRAWLSEGSGGGEHMLNIHVKDTGGGIAPAEQEKIFENYYTTATQGKHKGAGIGLALTRSLVKLHKGDISVESAPEEGALFRVSVNVDKEAYTAEQISDIPVETSARMSPEYVNESNGYLRQARIEIQNRSPKRFQILVVEDNRELNEFVRQIFSGDFDILTAYDGMEGYEMAVKMMPDIIISDIVMPGMDGLEMTRRLKSELLTSHIPVALLTARNEEREKIEGFEYGADAYIEKPFNPQRLELQVKNLLNTRYSNIERFKHETKFDTKKLTRNPRDEKFLDSMVDVIMRNLDNDRFAVKDITDALGISRSLLHIKLKNLADLSVTEFIRNIRMKEARERLVQGMNVSEASFAVGISDPNYFTKCFKKQFGQTPSDFIRTLK